MTEYKVGDPDPTPDLDSGDYCDKAFDNSGSGVWFCTWKHGHTGVHVSGTGNNGGVIEAVWDN